MSKDSAIIYSPYAIPVVVLFRTIIFTLMQSDTVFDGSSLMGLLRSVRKAQKEEKYTHKKRE